MRLRKLSHNLSDEKFVIDGTGAYWANRKEFDDTENLPKPILPIRMIHDGISSDEDLWLNYLKRILFISDESADEILKIFKNEKGNFSLKRIVFDSYGINFVFKNRETKRCKEYVMGFVDTDSDPMTFLTEVDNKEIVFFRSKNCMSLTVGANIMRFNNDHTVEALE